MPMTLGRRGAWQWASGSVLAAGLALTGAASDAPAQTSRAGSAPDSTLHTISALAQRALDRHPSMGALHAAVDEARHAAQVAAASRLPRLDLATSATHFQEPMLVRPLHGLDARAAAVPFDETLLQGGVTLGYTLFDGGARGARIKQARSRTVAAEASLDETGRTLVWQTAGAYVQVVTKRQVLEAHEARVHALEAERRRVQQFHAVGRAARVDLLRAEAALSSARAERVQLVAALDVATRDLARLTGRGVGELAPERLAPLTLRDSTQPSRDAQLTAARQVSPAIARARAQLGAAVAGVQVARGGSWPEVRLVATHVGRGGGSTATRGEWSAGGVLTLPLFTGGATRSEVVRAEAVQRSAADLLRVAELQVEQELDRARAAVVEADVRAASLRDAAEQFAEVARIERLALEAGSGTQADYLKAEADLLAARAALAEARAAQISARIEVGRVVGELSPEWLHRTLEIGP